MAESVKSMVCSGTKIEATVWYCEIWTLYMSGAFPFQIAEPAPSHQIDQVWDEIAKKSHINPQKNIGLKTQHVDFITQWNIE